MNILHKNETIRLLQLHKRKIIEGIITPYFLYYNKFLQKNQAIFSDIVLTV